MNSSDGSTNEFFNNDILILFTKYMLYRTPTFSDLAP